MSKANIELLDDDRNLEFRIMVEYTHRKEIPGTLVDPPEPESIEIDLVVVESATCRIGGYDAPLRCDRDLAAAVLRRYEDRIITEIFQMEGQRWDVE